MMKCWICGEEATKTRTTQNGLESGDWWYKEPSKHYRSYCDKCFEKVGELKKQEIAEYVRLKKRQMFENAMESFEKQNIDLYKLKPAIDKVETYLKENPDKFDSSYEIMAAISLINSGVMFQMQKRILKYQVDIFIPSKKVIIEIDGERHKHRKDYDKERDEAIINELGYDWEIVRVSTDDIEKNALKLKTAVEKVLEYRAKNNKKFNVITNL